jgi:hypothetical protein
MMVKATQRTLGARLMVEVLRQIIVTITTGLTRERKLTLSSSGAGRVVLHFVCVWRDHRYAWHWRGMVREFKLA